MDVVEEVQQFARGFAGIYLRFHQRVPHPGYRPGREALAVLRHLRDIGPVTVGEASAHFERSQAATSEILTRLERRGMLERLADERDRRRMLVWLTSAGLEVLEREEQVLSTSLLEHAFQQMNESDRRRLLRGFEALLNTTPRRESS